MDLSTFTCVFVWIVLALGGNEACLIHVTTNGARVQSPSYPDYENNQRCTYLIEAPQGHVISVNFNEFDIESSLRCHFDYLEFYDGWSTTSAYIGKFCGHSLPRTVRSSGNALMAKFQSDHLRNRKGFEAVVTFSIETDHQEEPFPETAYATVGITTDDVTNLPTVTNATCPKLWSLYGSHCYYVSTHGRFFHDAKDFCMDIGGELASIHSMNEQIFVHGLLLPWASGYFIGLTKENKEWVFLDQSNVTFFNWGEGEPNDRYDENCVEMYYEHSGAWNDVTCLSALKGSICKRLAGNIQKEAVPECFIHVTSSNSTIQSPSYPGYGSDQICTYLMEAPEGQVISVHFTDFSLESHSDCKYDYLKFYYSRSIDTFDKWKLCGFETPEDVTSSGNVLMATFHSDGSVHEKGFEAIVTFKDTSDEDYYTPANDLTEFVTDDLVDQQAVTEAPAITSCDIGWTIYRVNQSYCFMESEKEWGMASLMCADIGGHLLQVEDHEENDFIQSSTGNIHFGIIWLGISDEDEEGVWMTDDNRPVSGYTNWDTFEPNNYLNEDCAIMSLSSSYEMRRGFWHDNPCCHEFPFICEKN